MPDSGLVAKEEVRCPGPSLAEKHSYRRQLLFSQWVTFLLGNGLSGDTPNSQRGAVILLLVSTINQAGDLGDGSNSRRDLRGPGGGAD